jgi:hypothetical protein
MKQWQQLVILAILVGILCVLASIIIGLPESNELLRHKHTINSLKTYAIAVENGAVDFANNHAGSYPRHLDTEFISLIQSRLSDIHSIDTMRSQSIKDWLIVRTVQKREEAFRYANLLNRQQILYCARVSAGHATGFFILGKDERGDLLQVQKGPMAITEP